MDTATLDLLDIFREAAGEVSANGEVPHLAPETEIAELAFDSVQLAELVSALEERTGRHADPDRLYDVRTVRDLLAVVDGRSTW